MVKKVAVLIAAAAILGAAGCKSSTGPPDDSSFIGTWHATKAEYTSIANSSTKADIIAQGSTLTLAFSTSTFVLTITDPGQNPETFNGTWSASSDVMTLTWTSGLSGESQFDWSLSGNELILTGGHMPFDFTPGSFEEATLNLILVKP
jgi:hypothetical protein